MKPGTLSVKAVNQYRRRDIIPYLGLRYYLDNTSAIRDRWINEISTNITSNRIEPNYLKSYHFKDIVPNGKTEHRTMYFPGPNEALAETALLTELSRHESFRSASYVFSYKFSSTSSKQGVFEPYFNGFKERHNGITKACKETKDGLALYTDIKKFYPNISAELAKISWDSAVNTSTLSKEFIALGNKILSDHKFVCNRDNTGKGLLTGPMFSHVIANLILNTIDEEMHKLTNGAYWRYVDDIVMVGNNDQLDEWRNILENKLHNIGLDLHYGNKDFKVSVRNWLKGENDFKHDIETPWIPLIGSLKRFLLSNPKLKCELEKAFLGAGINIPIKNYEQAVKESSFLLKINVWIRKYSWSKSAVRRITIESLITAAKITTEYYKAQLNELLDKTNPDIDLYERKRLIPKLRYYSGRLLLLLNKEGLLELSENLKNYDELLVLSEVMNAIAKRDVSKIVELGANITQAAAQILRLSDNPVKCSIENINDINQQSLAVLAFNGLVLDTNKEQPNENLNKFANCKDIHELMMSPDPFIQEIACLHGITESRHSEMLNKAFDLDEDLAFDIINQLQNSSHC